VPQNFTRFFGLSVCRERFSTTTIAGLRLPTRICWDVSELHRSLHGEFGVSARYSITPSRLEALRVFDARDSPRERLAGMRPVDTKNRTAQATTAQVAQVGKGRLAFLNNYLLRGRLPSASGDEINSTRTRAIPDLLIPRTVAAARDTSMIRPLW
jgi:hypothetical protein